MRTPASIEFDRRPASHGLPRVRVFPDMRIRGWGLVFMALLLLSGTGQVHAQAGSLVATMERTTPGPASSIPAPGYASYRLRVFNTHNSNQANNVVVTHRFGPDALYGVTVTCTEHGLATCPAGGINIQDGSDAGQVRITIPSLPTGGGPGDAESHLEYAIKGVVRGHPAPLGTITHRVQAVDSAGNESVLVQIQDVLSTESGPGKVVSQLSKTLETSPSNGGLPWDEDLSYTLRFTNAGSAPMPFPNFADMHQFRTGAPSEDYTSSGVISNRSQVDSCTVIGAKPADAPPGPQGCPYSAGETWNSQTAMRPVLPRRGWDQVLYPGQTVEVKVREIIRSPGCLVHGSGDVSDTGRLNLTNRAFFNYRPQGSIAIYQGERGSNRDQVLLRMRPLPDCNVADLTFDLEETLTPPNPANLSWGQPMRWNLLVENNSERDYGDVPVLLRNTIRAVQGTTSSNVQWQVVNCTASGGAVCPWSAGSLPSGSLYFSGGGVHKVVFNTAGATIPQGGGLDIEVQIRALNPGDACRSISLKNSEWEVSVDNPPASQIEDSDGNLYDSWNIVGNTGGPNNSVFGSGSEPSLIATGNARANYTSSDPDCESDDDLKDADPSVTQVVAQAPIVGGSVAYDVIVTNTSGSPGIINVSLSDDLTDSGIDLSPAGIAGFSVTCQATANGASCPGGATPGGGIICEGASCPLNGSDLPLLIESLPANGSVTVRFTGAFSGTEDGASSGEYYNVASIQAGTDADYRDTDLGNNLTVLSSGSAQASGTLRLSKVVDDDGGYNPGDTFDFSLTCGTFILPVITLAAGDSEDISVPAEVACTVEEGLLPPPAPGYVWEEPIYSPTDTRTVPRDGVRTIEVVNSTSPIPVEVQKTVGPVTTVSPGVHEVTYTITATNNSANETTYSLEDVFQPDADVSPVAGYPQASYAGGDGLETTLGTFPQIVTNEGIAGGGGVDSYEVVVRYTTGEPDDPDDNACTGVAGNGLFNRAQLTTAGGSEEVAEACADNPYTALPTIAKELVAQSGSSDAYAEPGEELTYQITITNPGTVDLQDVAVVDTIPAHTSFVSADSGGAAAGDEVQWEVDVAAGASMEIAVVFKVDDVVPDGVGRIVNNATANGETCATRPCVSTPFANPVLAISKQLTAENGDVEGVAEPGEELEYTITVTNTGDVAALGATVVDITPDNTTARLPAGSDGSINAGGNAEWTLDVGAGQSVARKVLIDVDTPLPDGVDRIDNDATVNGEGCATTPCVSTPTAEASLTISKQLTGEDGEQADIAEPGEELTYTITVRNVTQIDATGVSVVDPIPDNTTLVSVGNGGSSNADSAQWTVDVAAGSSVDLVVTFRVNETLPADVTAIINNVTVNGEECASTPCVRTPTAGASLTIGKQLTGEDGEQAGFAEPGEMLTYRITVINASGVDATGVSIVDVTPANTTLELPAGSDGVVNADGNAEWTVDVGAGASVTRTVMFTVDDSLPGGVEQIVNNATVNDAPCATMPCVSTPVADPVLTISKALADEDGKQAQTAEPGEKLTYAITVTNESGVAASDVAIVDPVPANTSFVSASNNGTLSGGQVQWTVANIPAGGVVKRTVTFQVADSIPADVAEIVNNAAVNDEPCAELPCVSTPVADPSLAISKELTSESGQVPGYVEPGEQLTYTITIENTGGVDARAAEVVDLLPDGTTFVSANAGGAAKDGNVVWTVDVAAGEIVPLELIVAMADTIPAGQNAVINDATVNGERCVDTPCVQTPVASPPVAVDDESGNHLAGDRAVTNVLENDRIGSAALDPAGVWIEGAAAAGDSLTVAGEGVWSIDPQTGAITFVPDAGFTDDPSPVRYSIADVIGMRSNYATITLDYVQDTILRLTKVASARTAVIGDLLRYTLTIENVGTSDVTNATLLDTPPLGFALLPESVRVVDDDAAGHLADAAPMRIEQIDIAVGETATVTYFMAVGATALPGAHTNEAVMLLESTTAQPNAGLGPAAQAAAVDTRGVISNVATATVILESDPLFDQALILGTVFDDRDADGWQDSAEATGVTVRGLMGSGYVPGSLTVDRGAGPEPLADDASSDGVELGRLAGRSTIAEAEDANRIVVSRQVRGSRTDDGITVATAQGTTVHLAPDGTTRTDRDGDAAKGLTAQDIRVRRVVTPGDGVDQVDYVITNAGVQEQGIPGVRLGTIEGLLIETDAYGRYHLEGVETGHYARGSNFLIKVDAATLPPGSKLTTENPRIRRITPGMPVRFDFGVQVPEQIIEGGASVEELDLGEVLFEANSAEIRPEQRSEIAGMAEALATRGGGEVEVVGNGGDPELAYARAKAVADMLAAELDETVRANTTVVVRGEIDGPEILTLGDRVVIGEVFFDTDSAAIKPEYAGLIADIAEDIEAGGIPYLLITGHADRRASDAYNLALGKRRAEAMYDAIAGDLSQQRREQLQVEHMPPTKQAPTAGQAGGRKEANR